MFTRRADRAASSRPGGAVGHEALAFRVINDGDKPKVQVSYKGETKAFYPEEISADGADQDERDRLEAYSGHPVTNAVITVPAH